MQIDCLKQLNMYNIQNTNATEDFYSSGNITVIYNTTISNDTELLKRLNAYDKNYKPSTLYDKNKTIINNDSGNKVIIQLIIHFNKMDILIPSNAKSLFMNSMFMDVLKYSIENIKSCCTYSTANEINFGLNFYFECESGNNNPNNLYVNDVGNIVDKWGLEYYPRVDITSMNQSLYGYYDRYKMNMQFDSSFNLLDHPKTLETSKNLLFPGKNKNACTLPSFGSTSSIFDKKTLPIFGFPL